MTVTTVSSPEGAVGEGIRSSASVGHRVAVANIGHTVFFMGLSVILIPALNAVAMHLSNYYSIAEIVWARYAGHFALMMLLFVPGRGLRLLVTAQPLLQLFRSALLCAATALFFAALGYISLSTATAINFSAPLIVAALAPIVLREYVGFQRWLAIMIGLAGVVVVVRPSVDAEYWAAILIFASATCAALYELMTRKLAAHDSAETSITYIALVGFVLSSLALPFVWKTPEQLLDILFFAALGLLGGFGHYCIVRAYELAPAPFVSPFNYLQIVTAAILGYAIFEQVPDIWSIVGALIIVASGIYIVADERNSKMSLRSAGNPSQEQRS